MAVIGKRIKELRKKSKYTQSELANLLGITKSTVAAYENDSRLPSYDVLIKMARIFKVSIDYLITGQTGSTLEIDGLKAEQLEAIDFLISSFRKSNLMEEILIDRISGEDTKKTERLMAYADKMNDLDKK